MKIVITQTRVHSPLAKALSNEHNSDKLARTGVGYVYYQLCGDLFTKAC